MKRLLPLLLLTACPPQIVVDPNGSDGALGADPAEAFPPEEARAGQVRTDGESALFAGITAEGQVGDFMLLNDRVQFVVQGVRRGHGYVNTAGNIIDVDLVRPTLGRDLVEDVFLGFSLARLFDATEISVVNDGTDGTDAVVQATGIDVPWAFFQGMLESPKPTVDDLNLSITTTYTLPPQSFTLHIDTVITNTGEEAVTVTPQDGIFASGEDAIPWTTTGGLTGSSGDSPTSLTFTGRQGEASFSIWPDSGAYSSNPLTDILAELGIATVENPTVILEPGESTNLVRHLSVHSDVAGVEAERLDHQGVALTQVSGAVSDSEGPVAGVRVHFGGESWAGFAITDARGQYAARLPQGSWTGWAVARADTERTELPTDVARLGGFAAPTVRADTLSSWETRDSPLPWATGYPTPPGETVEVATTPVTVDFNLSPMQTLRVRTDGVPAILDVRRTNGLYSSAVPADLREAVGVPDGSREAWGWTGSGELTMAVMPGTFEVTVGHSWRHEQVYIADVAVGVGGDTTIDAKPLEVIERDGWLSLDSHLHASPSMDGALPMEDRLITCAAAGVDVVIPTDHDAMVDYRDLATAMRLDDRMRIIPGVEVTTLIRGHFNLFPIEPGPATQPNGGAFAWWEQLGTTQELFDGMQTAAGPDAMTQVNHPRTPGMFSFANLDETTGEPQKPDHWSWDFGAFELINPGGGGAYSTLRDDWFSLLDSGFAPVPTGVSDSHYRYIPCGVAHTDVYVGVDDPTEATADDVMTALRAGHVVAASGTTLRATLDLGDGESLPGDTVVGTTGTLSITVRSPGWIQPGTVRVWHDHEVVWEQTLTDAVDTVWLDDRIQIDVSEDGWLVVEVEGTEPMGDIWRNEPPYAATNAFFIDIDGDGWDLATDPSSR